MPSAVETRLVVGGAASPKSPSRAVPSAREPHVGGLEVAVHDPGPCACVERGGDLLAEPDDSATGSGSARRAAARRATRRDVLRNDVRRAVLVADVEDGDDVRVVAEARHRARFAVDAAAAGVVEAVGAHDRDRDLAIEPRVARDVHTLARPLPDEGADLIAPAVDGLGRRGRVGGWERGAAGVAEPGSLPVLVAAGRAGHGIRLPGPRR